MNRASTGRRTGVISDQHRMTRLSPCHLPSVPPSPPAILSCAPWQCLGNRQVEQQQGEIDLHEVAAKRIAAGQQQALQRERKALEQRTAAAEAAQQAATDEARLLRTQLEGGRQKRLDQERSMAAKLSELSAQLQLSRSMVRLSSTCPFTCGPPTTLSWPTVSSTARSLLRLPLPVAHE